MANSAGINLSFKQELLKGVHNLDLNSLKMALYQTTASIGPSSTVYTTTGEVAATGTYAAGGPTVSNGTTSLSGTTAVWTPAANISLTGVTLTTDCAFLYNTSQGNKGICVFTFGSQSVTAGNFTLTMPVNDATNALIRAS